MPTNWAGLQVRSAPIFTLLSNNTAQDPQVCPSRTDVPWLQVPHKVAGRSYPSISGFRGTVSAQPKEDANEGARRQEEECENFRYTGWGCSAGETRAQQQSLTTL